MNEQTQIYIELKEIADKAYAHAQKHNTDADWDNVTDTEMDVADYAYINEDKIEWELVNA